MKKNGRATIYDYSSPTGLSLNGHPRDQAKVSVHCRWPFIRGTDRHVVLCRDIDNVAVHSRWPLTTGVAQGRYSRPTLYDISRSTGLVFARRLSY